MPWQDRLKEGAYTSPSGARATFTFEDVSANIPKKTAAFESPDAPGTYVQDNGIGGGKYPVKLIFHGDDHDTESNAFMALLSETGIGFLEHPRFGNHNVVPFGDLEIIDALKTAANQTIINVVFWETTGILFPTNQVSAASQVLQAVTDFNIAASEEFEELSSLDTVLDQTVYKNRYIDNLNNVSSSISKIAETQKNVERRFRTIENSINQSIDVLIADPLTLANQTVQLIQTPARARTSIQARIDGYVNIITGYVTGDKAIFPLSLNNENSNTFHTNDLYASSCITGIIASCVNNEFEFKSDVLSAIDSLLEQFAIVTNWRDDNFESLQEIDTGGSYQALQDAVAITAGFLLQVSFTLAQERKITLESPRSIIDLCYELYGEVDNKLNFFIDTNSLSGSEILEIPKGREVVYYV